MGTPITTTIDITQDRKVTMPIPARIESPENGNTRLATPCFFEEGLPDYANVDSRARSSLSPTIMRHSHGFGLICVTARWSSRFHRRCSGL